MTTKTILFPGSQPTPDAAGLPPGPASARPEKPGKDFSAVMDQATKPRPAHSRTTRSSTRSRSEDAPVTPARVRPERTAKMEASAKSPAVVSKPDSKVSDPKLNEQQVTALAAAPKPEKADGVSVEEEHDDSEAVSLVVEEEVAEEAEETESKTPTNILVFPGVVAPMTNIIPFPLVTASVTTGSGTESQAKTVPVEAATGALGEAAPAIASDVIIPLSDAAARETARAAVSLNSSPERDQGGGIDVNELGLKPVSEEEATELSRSVSPPPTPTAAPSHETVATSPSSNVIEVAFRATTAPAVIETPAVGVKQAMPVVAEKPAEPQAQLPGDVAQRAESAPPASNAESSAKIVLLRADAAKSAAGAGLPPSAQPVAGGMEAAGTSVARQGFSMESTMTSERAKVAAESGATALETLPPSSSGAVGHEDSANDFSARTAVAVEWQTGRPSGVVERSDSDSQDVKAIDGTGTVERISSLMLRESALVKKHGSDSMAVVLRPDAETELFVHLSQRNGQIEATVRCERGDVQHLGALWSQLQESLALHKVRLAPLEETPSGHSNFNQQPGSRMSGGQNGTREETRPEKQSMDERPAPAASRTPAPHVRGADGSRSRRITTSSPGWETWA